MSSRKGVLGRVCVFIPRKDLTEVRSDTTTKKMRRKRVLIYKMNNILLDIGELITKVRIIKKGKFVKRIK